MQLLGMIMKILLIHISPVLGIQRRIDNCKISVLINKIRISAFSFHIYAWISGSIINQDMSVIIIQKIKHMKVHLWKLISSFTIYREKSWSQRKMIHTYFDQMNQKQTTFTYILTVALAISPSFMKWLENYEAKFTV